MFWETSNERSHANVDFIVFPKLKWRRSAKNSQGPILHKEVSVSINRRSRDFLCKVDDSELFHHPHSIWHTDLHEKFNTTPTPTMCIFLKTVYACSCRIHELETCSRCPREAIKSVKTSEKKLRCMARRAVRIIVRVHHIYSAATKLAVGSQKGPRK